jgi:hypothetical protein
VVSPVVVSRVGDEIGGVRTSVAHSKLTKMTIARQFCCSGTSMMGTISSTISSTTKTAMQASSIQKVWLISHCGHRYRPIGVSTSFISGSSSSP